jgi:hypothetical protein
VQQVQVSVERPRRQTFGSFADEVAVQFLDADRRELERAKDRDQMAFDDRLVALPRRALEALRRRIGGEPFKGERFKLEGLELAAALPLYVDEALAEGLLGLALRPASASRPSVSDTRQPWASR